MYEYLLKKAGDLQRENYTLKAMLSTMYGRMCDVPFDLRCPGPRYEDSPEGDCGNCPYMQHGRCTAEDEGPDEPTGEYDEIDPGDRNDGFYYPPTVQQKYYRIPFEGKVMFTDACDFVQVYLNDEGQTIFVIKWQLVKTKPEQPFVTVKREGAEKSVHGHAILVLKAIVDTEVFEDLEFDEIMEDVIDEAEDVTGFSLADAWERVIKTEVKRNEQ